MKKKSFFVIFIVLTNLFMVACQPTPEKPAVQSKGDGTLEQRIAADEKPPAKYEAPNRWTDTIYSKADKITVEIDADISVPETDTYPVVRIEKYELSKKWVMGLVGRLSKDGKTYSYKNELMLTKSDVSEIIQQLMDDMADPNSNINSTRFSEEERARLKMEREQEIEGWQSFYKKAPDKFETKEIPIMFESDNAGGKYFDCGINMGYKNMTELNISQFSETGGEVLINISDGVDTGEILRYTDDFTKRNNLEMTPDEAAALGLDFIKKMDDGVFTASLIRAGYMKMGESKNDVTDYPECYVIDYTRSCENVPTTYRDAENDMSLINERMNEKLVKQNQYAPYLAQESIKLVITDKGVTAAVWTMPTMNADTINKNVELLPFDNIQEIFKKQMSVEGLITNPYGTGIVSRKIVITKAVLGMSQIREKNTENGLIMIPTWSFFGYEVYTFDGQQAGGYKLNENNEYINDQLHGHSFLTINAIDGSIINPLVGY